MNKGYLENVLNLNTNRTPRSNECKLDRFRFRKEICKNWFTNRLVEEWNKLSKYHIVEANTINGFKLKPDRYMLWEGRR